jgi:hypothetical protein
LSELDVTVDLRRLSKGLDETSHGVGDLPCHEFNSAQGRFVIEEDAARGMQAEALAVIHGHPVSVELGDTVWRAWIKGRRLGLYRLLDQAEHFGGRCLIDTRLGPHDPHRLQHVRCADPGYLTGQQRLRPGGFHKRLRGEIVNLRRLNIPDNPDKT